MTAHVDPNAAHAVFAPSSAHRWMECTASAEAIQAMRRVVPEDENEHAVAGTAAHEEIERCLEPVAYFANGCKPAPVNPDHPAAYGVSLVLDYVQQLQAAALSSKMWIEQRVILTEQIWGRCDVAHWDPASETLTIVDYKNGYVGVDAEENEQLQIYAAATIYTQKLPVKYVRLVVIQPNDFRPLPRVKQHVMTVADLYEFATRAASVPGGPKVFKAGQGCTYCPLFGRCPATRDLLAQLSVAMQHTPDDVPLANRAIFSALAKPLTDWFKGADKTWTKDALSGKVPEGMKLVTTASRRAWKDEAEARELVIKEKGVEYLEPPTPAQVEKLGVTIPEGLIGTPPGGPALAFESDKRAPWVRKGVDEMFAGVPK